MSAVLSGPAEEPHSPTKDRSVEELDIEIRRLARQISIECYQMLVLVCEFDDRFGWKKWGHKSCAEWLAWSCGITPSTAREKVRTAHALRRLPAIAAAFAEGRLTYSKVRALTRVASGCDEDLLLAYALDATVPQVEERCRQIRNVSPQSAHDAWRAWAARSLTVWRDDRRGLMRFTVEVPVEDGELVCRALDCAVAAGEVTRDVDPVTFDPEDSDPADVDSSAVAESRGTAWRAQQADAFVAVVKSYLDGGHGHDGGTTADRYQVVVHVDGKALKKGEQVPSDGTCADTGGKGLSDLPIDTVKRLLCDCSLVVVAEDEHGQPLDVGRKLRTVSTPLRRALYARDRGCKFPGCHRRRYVEAHHVKHWIDLGETTARNTVLLCAYHHKLLHEGGLGLVTEPDGTLRFVTADGRTIPRGGYRLEDFVDDKVGALDASRDASGGIGDDASRDGLRTPTENPSRDAFGSTTTQRPPAAPNEVREPDAVYLVTRAIGVLARRESSHSSMR